jgi:hypothetical protein
MQLAANTYRQKIQVLLDELSPADIREVYHFARFLHEQTRKEKESPAEFPAVPASHLRSLAGLIQIGGDAVQDAEDLYHA